MNAQVGRYSLTVDIADSRWRYHRLGIAATDVPARGQWARALENSAIRLTIVAGLLMLTGGMFYLGVVLQALSERTPVWLLVLTLSSAAMVLLGLLAWAGFRWVPALQQRALSSAREHWTAAHREVADGKELIQTASEAPTGPLPGALANRLSSVFMSVTGVGALVAIMGASGLALLLLIVIGTLVEARNRHLRDRIVQRWPVRPLPFRA